MVAIAFGKYILYLTDLRCIWLCSIVSCLCYTVMEQDFTCDHIWFNKIKCVIAINTG